MDHALSRRGGSTVHSGHPEARRCGGRPGQGAAALPYVGLEDGAPFVEGARMTALAGGLQPLAVHDGNLITGQQGSSGRDVAELVSLALGACIG